MGYAVLPSHSLTFLQELKKNNNRPWFNENKDRYTDAREHVIELVDEILHKLSRMDIIETSTGKSAMYRIYRDVRFSKDKTPYNTHWSALFRRATAARRGSYYLRIEPGGKSLAGGGFWRPNPADMKLIRSHIDADPDAFRQVLKSRKFRDMFGQLEGEQVKTAPKGYSRDNPAIDLLRYKQFFASRTFTDQEVLSGNFAKEVVKTYQAIRPFFDYMSEILTTDLNGESLL
jgi:uncharacterized protein (TIGR02453 family)